MYMSDGTNDSGVCSASRGLSRDTCYITETEDAERDVIAVVRIVVSVLSILGTFSIIVSSIYKKQACSPKVHPIFVLSIADCLLAVLWVVGGGLWLRGVQHAQVGCFTVTLMTVILECVTINLTLVYALLAYASIKQKDFSNVYIIFDRPPVDRIWHPCKITLVYFIAWMLPVILIMTPFGIIAGVKDIVQDANKCSCWCLPYFGNVIPFAFPTDKPTARFVYNMRMFIVSYGLVVGTNYLVVLTLLVIIYYKILKRIKNMRKRHEQNGDTHNLYGATEATIIRGQSQAKTRVVYFLTVFVITGLFNTILSYGFVFFECYELNQGAEVKHPPSHIPILPLYILQSLTMPLQGFLNAIVYGWTREDFLKAMSGTTHDLQGEPEPVLPQEGGAMFGDSGILVSTEEEEHSLSSSTPRNMYTDHEDNAS